MGVSIRRRLSVVFLIALFLVILGGLIIRGTIPGEESALIPQSESEVMSDALEEEDDPFQESEGIPEEPTVQEITLREVADRVTGAAFLRAQAARDAPAPRGRIISPDQPRLGIPSLRGREIVSALLSHEEDVSPVLDPASEPFLREILPSILQELPRDPTVLFPVSVDPEVVQAYLVHPEGSVQLVLYIHNDALTDIEIFPIAPDRVRSLSELTSSEELFRTILP